MKVRFKAALSPRGDNGVLYSVTSEGCGIALSLPLLRPLGIHLPPVPCGPAWRTGRNE